MRANRRACSTWNIPPRNYINVKRESTQCEPNYLRPQNIRRL